MGKSLAALVAGLLFGAGLVVGGMVDPAKVLAFLDVFGAWDPSLALVMASALVVTAIGYRVAPRRPAPVFENLLAAASGILLYRLVHDRVRDAGAGARNAAGH